MQDVPPDSHLVVKGTNSLSVCGAGILQEAMGRGEYWRLVDGQGRPPGLMGMWPSRAVTFIENHDTGQPHCTARQGLLSPVCSDWLSGCRCFLSDAVANTT